MPTGWRSEGGRGPGCPQSLGVHRQLSRGTASQRKEPRCCPTCSWGVEPLRPRQGQPPKQTHTGARLAHNPVPPVQSGSAVWLLYRVVPGFVGDRIHHLIPLAGAARQLSEVACELAGPTSILEVASGVVWPGEITHRLCPVRRNSRKLSAVERLHDGGAPPASGAGAEQCPHQTRSLVRRPKSWYPKGNRDFRMSPKRARGVVVVSFCGQRKYELV